MTKTKVTKTNIIKFPNAKERTKTRGRGITLCRNGYHQWDIAAGNPFDVKSGKLVTHFRCRRCSANKTELR